MVLLENKRARFDYEILEEFDSGIKLQGFEVKSLKMKRGMIGGAHIIVRGAEAFIVGMEIPPYQPKNTPENYDPAHSRKLLLQKKEIEHLAAKDSQKGLTIIPLRVYTKGGLIKLSFAVAKGLKKHDKRQKIKQREAKKEIERRLKQSY